ncbi:MAG: PEP-CTERM sorting domain-containing protein [Syntrophobacteraceae bacterium]|nr:PEP-CTERM sorting domain-containing protein [Syntrophobacteraceae bacterium]
MKRLMYMFIAVTFLLGVATIASADTISYDLTVSNLYLNADQTWASFSVTLPQGQTIPTDIASYTPTSLKLVVNTTYPDNTWIAKVYNSSVIESEVSHTGNNQQGGSVTFDFSATDFNNTSYKWYSSPIEFSAQADCHVTGATFYVTAEKNVATPEPGTILLLGLGLFGLAILGKKSELV